MKLEDMHTWENFMQKAEKDYKKTLQEENKVVRKILREAERVKHSGGVCWRFVGKHDEQGYGVTSVQSKTRIASRLVKCVTGKPRRPYPLSVNPDRAGHLTPVICRFRDCINPSHLKWESVAEGIERRERDKHIDPAEVLARFDTLAVKLGKSIL